MMKRGKKRKINIFETLNAVYIGAMGSLYLLFPGFSGYAGITREKWTLYMILSVSYAAVMLILWMGSVLRDRNRTERLAQGWREMTMTEKLLLLFLGATLLSALFSVDRKTAFLGAGRFEGFFVIAMYVICFLLISRFGRAEKSALWAFGIGVSLCGIVAILQFFGGNPMELYPAGMDYYDGNRLYLGEYLGTIGNVDILSAVLCLAIPICWIGLLVLKSREKWLLVIPLVISLAVLLKMFVAGGILGVFGGVLLTVPVLAKEKKTRRILTGAVAAVVVLGLGVVYLWGDGIGGFVAEASQIMHGNFDDRFGSGRIYIWREVLKLVPERLLLGGGPETLSLRNNAMFERYDEELGVLIQTTVDVAHNEYLNVLVNEGLIAFAAYLGALLVAAKGWIDHAAEDAVVAICGGAVLGYCIQAFFGISSPITAPFFWIVFALLAGRLRGYQKKTEKS